MGYIDAECLLYLCLVQHGIMRTRRLGRKLIRMQRAYLAGLYAGQAMDSQREIIPRAHTLVAEMIDTGNNPPVDSRKMARAKSLAYVGVPIWSKTTPSVSRSRPRRSIVFTKLFP